MHSAENSGTCLCAGTGGRNTVATAGRNCQWVVIGSISEKMKASKSSPNFQSRGWKRREKRQGRYCLPTPHAQVPCPGLQKASGGFYFSNLKLKTNFWWGEKTYIKSEKIPERGGKTNQSEDESTKYFCLGDGSQGFSTARAPLHVCYACFCDMQSLINLPEMWNPFLTGETLLHGHGKPTLVPMVTLWQQLAQMIKSWVSHFIQIKATVHWAMEAFFSFAVFAFTILAREYTHRKPKHPLETKEMDGPRSINYSNIFAFWDDYLSYLIIAMESWWRPSFNHFYPQNRNRKLTCINVLQNL